MNQLSSCGVIDMLNIARRLDCTTVEGPGKRAVIWLQGCLKRCPGCCNAGYLPIRMAEMTPISTVTDWLLMCIERHQIEGITLLGGEPLLQTQGLFALTTWCKEHNLTVMLFTGYSSDELERVQIPKVSDVLANCDVVVAGPYQQDSPETIRNWVGSSNQEFIYVTDRYTAAIETSASDAPTLEVVIQKDGVDMHGYPLARLKTKRFVEVT